MLDVSTAEVSLRKAGPLGVRDDPDGMQQLVDGVDEVLVCRRDTLDARLRHGRRRQVIQVGVELHT